MKSALVLALVLLAPACQTVADASSIPPEDREAVAARAEVLAAEHLASLGVAVEGSTWDQRKAALAAGAQAAVGEYLGENPQPAGAWEDILRWLLGGSSAVGAATIVLNLLSDRGRGLLATAMNPTKSGLVGPLLAFIGARHSSEYLEG